MKKIVLAGMIIFAVMQAQAQPNRRPQITQQPVPDTVVIGGSAEFSVVSTGNGLNYQWQKNNFNISGATAATLSIASVTANDAGLYRVIVSNAFGRDTSINAALMVQTPPIIVMHPKDTSAVGGQAVTFSVSASGTDPLSYQWQKNGVNIAGATGQVLTLPSVQANDTGYYRAVVSNEWGSAISERAWLTVFVPPQISSQPHDTTVRQGQTTRFTVVASGTAPLSYRWQKNGVTISSFSARTATYTITSTQLQDSGSYRAIISNAYGSDTSTSARLTCLPLNPSDTAPPQIIVQPRDTAVLIGGTATFFVVVVSATSVTYRWEKDGEQIRGAQGTSYTIGSAIAQDAGNYRVIVTNQYGRDTSNAAILVVGTLPVITQQPSSASVEEGGVIGFSVVAGGTAPLAYQWQKNGIDIEGAVAATYRITETALNDSGTYRVIVSNPLGSVTSNGALLTVTKKPPIIQKPTVTSSPASKTAIVGDTVTFAVIASGTAPLSYQWQKNGADITGAQSAGLTLAAVKPGDSGIYRVIVSNRAGEDTSDNAFLRVLPNVIPQEKPVITLHPYSQKVPVGGAASFVVAAAGARPFVFQWQKNSMNITGAKDSIFTIAAVAYTDSGAYRVIVSNSFGADTSAIAALTVTQKPPVGDPPVIWTHPSSQKVYAGDTVTFSVAASGTAPLFYQWQKNGANIANAQSAALVISSVLPADSGVYRVVVSNSVGAATSNNALLSVVSHQATNTKPIITISPASQTAILGGSVTFSVIATGSAPLYYQWQKNGTDIPNAKTSTFAIAAVALTDSGAYRVIVFNSLGADTSAIAHLQVLPGPIGQISPVIIRHPCSQKTFVGESVSFTVSALGAQPMSYQWQKNGVNRTNAKDSILTISPVALGDSGTYRVIVSNSLGATVSFNASLTVKPKIVVISYPPVIHEHPSSKNAVVGDSVMFAVVASGTGPLSYQWQKNGVKLAGATSMYLKIARVAVSDSGAYRVTVSSPYGQETSFEARLNVYEPPRIMNNPASQLILAGAPVTFTVAAAGSPLLFYQWQKDGTDIAGANTASFTITSTSLADNGTYRVVVTNSWGTSVSEGAILTVKDIPFIGKVPAITMQPSSRTVAAGDSADFTVIAVCTEQISYQWKKNDAAISGANAATLRITSATAEDAGAYRVVVSSKYGSETSNSATLTVLLPFVQGSKPVIVRDPASVTASIGDSLRMSVSVNGTVPMRFQWRKNGAAIAGATDSVFKIDSVRSSDGGPYDVVVINLWGSDTSKPATITIASAKPVVYWTRNPVRASEGAFFTIDIPDTGKASACIADMGGNMVYNLIARNTPFNPGVYRIEWRGQNSRGSFSGPGSYIYVFSYTRRSNNKTTVIRKPVFLVK
jgi:hypothetical protein